MREVNDDDIWTVFIATVLKFSVDIFVCYERNFIQLIYQYRMHKHKHTHKHTHKQGVIEITTRVLFSDMWCVVPMMRPKILRWYVPELLFQVTQVLMKNRYSIVGDSLCMYKY